MHISVQQERNVDELYTSTDREIDKTSKNSDCFFYQLF